MLDNWWFGSFEDSRVYQRFFVVLRWRHQLTNGKQSFQSQCRSCCQISTSRNWRRRSWCVSWLFPSYLYWIFEVVLQLTDNDISQRISERIWWNAPLSARIFLWGCMIAESAPMGLRMTLFASAKSIMTTWFCSLTFSRTQMKWSDSRVKV